MIMQTLQEILGEESNEQIECIEEKLDYEQEFQFDNENPTAQESQVRSSLIDSYLKNVKNNNTILKNSYQKEEIDEDLADTWEQFQFRDYQLDMFQKGIGKNSIIYLETGLGKTLVIIMLMWDRIMKFPNKKAIFLANTIQLVEQQATQIKLKIPRVAELLQDDENDVKYAIKLANSVQVIHGDKCADLCNPQLWEIVLSEYKIFVMTAQVFLNVLRKGVAKMSEFCFIAMDECHAAQQSHQYNYILQEFYFPLKFKLSQEGIQELPQIVGATASPIVNMKSQKHPEIMQDLMKLAANLDSTYLNTDEIGARIHLNEAQIEVINYKLLFEDPRIINLMNCNFHQRPIEDKKVVNTIIDDYGDDDFEDDTFLDGSSFDDDDMGCYGPPTFSSVLRDSKYIDEFFKLRDMLEEFQKTIVSDIKLTLLIISLKRILIIQGLQMYLELGKYVMFFLLEDIISKLKEYLKFISIEKENTSQLETIIQNLENFLTKISRLYILSNSCSPKVNTLLSRITEIFKYNRQATVLIFVKQRISACYLYKIIEAHLSQTQIYYEGEIKSDYIIGHVFRKPGANKKKQEEISQIIETDLLDEEELMNKLLKELQKDLRKFNISEFKEQIQKLSMFSQKISPIEQKEKLTKFRNGNLQILISTSVAEEGIDIPVCNFVIGFHPITSTKAYVQMKGRARKPGSKFLIFTADVKNAKKLNVNQHQQTQSITKQLINELNRNYQMREQIQQIQKQNEEDTFFESFTIEESGALISTNWSQSLIQQFCHAYVQGAEQRATPRFALYQFSNKYKTNTKYAAFLLLPINSQECIFKGQKTSSAKDAKASSCLQAAKWLFEKGYIDSNLKFCLNQDMGQHIGADQDDSQIMMTKKQLLIAQQYSVKVIRNNKTVATLLTSQLRYYTNLGRMLLTSKQAATGFFAYECSYQEKKFQLVFTNSQMPQMSQLIGVLSKFEFMFYEIQLISKVYYLEQFEKYLEVIVKEENLEQIEPKIYQKRGTNLQCQITNYDSLNVLFPFSVENQTRQILEKIILANKVLLVKEKLSNSLNKEKPKNQNRRIKFQPLNQHNAILETLEQYFNHLKAIKTGNQRNCQVTYKQEISEPDPPFLFKSIDRILYLSLDIERNNFTDIQLGKAYYFYVVSMQIYAGFFSKDIKVALNKYKTVTRSTFVRNYLLESQMFLYLQKKSDQFNDYPGFKEINHQVQQDLNELLNEKSHTKKYNLDLQNKINISNSEYMNFVYVSMAQIESSDINGVNGYKWLKSLGLSQTIKSIKTAEDLLQLFPYGPPNNRYVTQLKDCYNQLENNIDYKFKSFQLLFQAMTDINFRQVVNSVKEPRFEQTFSRKENNSVETTDIELSMLSNKFSDLNQVDATNFSNSHLAFLGKTIWKYSIVKFLVAKGLNPIQIKVCSKILTGAQFLSIFCIQLNVHEYLNCFQDCSKDLIDQMRKNQQTSLKQLIVQLEVTDAMKILQTSFQALVAAIFLDQNCNINSLHEWVPRILEKYNFLELIKEEFLVWQQKHRFFIWYQKKLGNPFDFNLIKIPHLDYKKQAQGEWLYIPYDTKQAQVVDLFQDQYSDITQLHFYAKSKERAYQKLYQKVLS